MKVAKFISCSGQDLIQDVGNECLRSSARNCSLALHSVNSHRSFALSICYTAIFLDHYLLSNVASFLDDCLSALIHVGLYSNKTLFVFYI